MARRRTGILAGVAVVLLLLIIFWNWDWFRPVVEEQASAALGRKVTMTHFGVRLGRVTSVSATGIVVANPDGFASPTPFVAIDRLQVDVDVLAYIKRQVLSITRIELDHPVVDARQLPDGSNNYTLKMKSSGGGGTPPELGQLVINNGQAKILMPAQKSNFALAIQTRDAPAGDKLFTGGEIVVDAKGTYAAAPITGHFIGGAVLSLRDASVPYPIDLHLENGTTKASLAGTIQDPAHFAGANLRLSFSGQDMANLYQLTGVPIPATPPFSLTGRLNYSKQKIIFSDIAGKVGSSDLEGTITETPAADENGRRQVTADLQSRQVDLTDLAGFLGGTPGKSSTPGQDEATKAKLAKANASPTLLPDTAINLPKINAANVDLRYKGTHIINKNVPLDNLVVHLVIDNGRITINPLNFAVGTGTIASDIDLNPVNNVLHTTANIDFRKLQLSRLMKATQAFAGNGTVGGAAHLTGTGNSVAQILGNGDGKLQLFMAQGGNISALLVDLAGLQAGDAILSALGIPDKTQIQCLVSDFTLTNGVVNTNALLLATSESNILGRGTVNLQNEKLDLAMRTEATHISIGSLSTPINITGTLKNPSILPAPVPLAAKVGAATALGFLFPPLALIPTIRLGLGDKNACADTLAAVHAGTATAK
jgi:uncharacterized protein involved in outer membrane biogenesis